MVTLTDDTKCCMTCARSEDCPILMQWVQENDDPMVVHYAYCKNYKKVEFPKG